MLTDKLVISVADVSDAEMLTELSVKTFRDTFDPHNRKEDMDKYVAEEMNIGKLSAELLDAGNVFFLAVYEGVTIGYAKMRALIRPEELEKNNPVEIERIYVSKDFHGKKIGDALMNHCVEYAKSKQYDMIWLGVWEQNYKAVSFYKRWGFELFGSHPFILGDDHQTDVLMKKVL